MYLLLMISLTAIFISAYILSKLFFNNRGSALLIISSCLLYFLPMVAGALLILRPYYLFIFALAALLLSIVAFSIKLKSLDRSIEINSIAITYCRRPIALELLLVAVPILGSFLWIILFVIQSMRHNIAHYYIPPLFWDVVEYHFPNLVNAVQSGSLWTTHWAHYPMGGEMFHAWGFSFLRNDALASPTHFFFSILLIFFSGFILHILCFQDRKALSGAEIVAYLIMTVMLLLLPPLWDMHFNQVGKNDIALSAFIMAALCFLLQCTTETSESKTFRQNILLLGITLGIIAGIKANGVLYAAFFFGMLLKDSFFKRIPGRAVVVAGLCVLLLAGFWYLRPLIMLGRIPPSGVHESVLFKLNHGLRLFLTGRENLLFSLSMGFCLIMGVIWHHRDLRLRVANYTLAASIVIFWLTPYGAWDGNMQLRLAPGTIPLVIIMGLATFLRLVVKTEAPLREPNSRTYRQAAIMGWVILGLGSAAMLAVPLMGGLGTKPRWAWNLRGLILTGFLAACLYIYNSVKPLKDYQLSLSRSFLSATAFLMVCLTLVIQAHSYRPSGDLPGYNENTSVYRWVYQNIRGKTICLLGLRPYGLYGQEFSNRVIYGGDSENTTLEVWLSHMKHGKVDYLVIGRDYAQHEGYHEYKPFPSDLAKVQASPDFKVAWSDDRAIIFSIAPSFPARGAGSGSSP